MKIFNLVSSKTTLLWTLLLLITIVACQPQNPNEDMSGKDILTSHKVIASQAKGDIQYQDTIYVPIYSDIYVSTSNPKHLLAATLSIRNTSLQDSLYISKIDYYNTEGDLVRSYLDNSILLSPMASIDYVIEREDVSGGSGANFILMLSANKKTMNPIIQGVMVGDDGDKIFAFTTNGHSISRKD